MKRFIPRANLRRMPLSGRATGSTSFILRREVESERQQDGRSTDFVWTELRRAACFSGPRDMILPSMWPMLSQPRIPRCLQCRLRRQIDAGSTGMRSVILEFAPRDTGRDILPNTAGCHHRARGSKDGVHGPRVVSDEFHKTRSHRR